MTAKIASENLELIHDNKQLSALIKEYEQTLETLMSAYFHFSRNTFHRPFRPGNFRNRAVRYANFLHFYRGSNWFSNTSKSGSYRSSETLNSNSSRRRNKSRTRVCNSMLLYPMLWRVFPCFSANCCALRVEKTRTRPAPLQTKRRKELHGHSRIPPSTH